MRPKAPAGRPGPRFAALVAPEVAEAAAAAAGLLDRREQRSNLPAMMAGGAVIRSMTGFGAGRAQVGGETVAVELRSVNGKFCDVRTHLRAISSRSSP